MNSKFNLKRLNKIKLFDFFYNQYKAKDEELSKLFIQRRAKEVLWVIRSYIKNESELNNSQINHYIKTNILTKEILSYLEWEYLKDLNIKNILQIFLLKYFPYLFIQLARSI